MMDNATAELDQAAELQRLRRRVRDLDRQLRTRTAAHHRKLLRWRREKVLLQRQPLKFKRRAATVDLVESSGVLSRK